MAQFAVHENPSRKTRQDIPFLLDVQSDLMSVLVTRVVVPLYRKEALGAQTMARLTPRVRFQGNDLVAMVPELAGVGRKHLGPAVGDLGSEKNILLQAIDLLLTGF